MTDKVGPQAGRGFERDFTYAKELERGLFLSRSEAEARCSRCNVTRVYGLANDTSSLETLLSQNPHNHTSTIVWGFDRYIREAINYTFKSTNFNISILNRLATIRDQSHPIHIARHAATEEHNGVCYLVRVAQAAFGVREDRVLLVAALERLEVVDKGRVDNARAHGVDPQAIGTMLNGGALRHAHHSVLGSDVRHHVGHGHKAADAGEIDDAAYLAPSLVCPEGAAELARLLQHGARLCLHAEHCRTRVDAHHPVELAAGHIGCL